jgi:hypothetical protein
VYTLFVNKSRKDKPEHARSTLVIHQFDLGLLKSFKDVDILMILLQQNSQLIQLLQSMSIYESLWNLR